MADDSILIALGTLGAVLLLALLFLAGRLFDIKFRCSQMRRWLKKNYFILITVSKDHKTLYETIVNGEGDAAFKDNRLYATANGYLYTVLAHDDQPINKLVKEALGQEEPIRIDKYIRWREGAPVLIVDNDSFLPLSFHKSETNVKPDEIGASINSYTAIKEAQNLMQNKNKDWQMWAVLIGIVIIIGGLYVCYTVLDEINIREKAMEARINLITPNPGTVQNGTLVINQKPSGAIG